MKCCSFTHNYLSVFLSFSLTILVVSDSWAEWQSHKIKRGDGKGGFELLPAQRQTFKIPGAKHTMPWGIASMENGEIAMLATMEAPPDIFQPMIAFSKDGGDNWTEFQKITETKGRPVNTAYLGGGKLTFVTDKRYFSSDYGRTWPESVEHQPTSDGLPFNQEGNPWVDRDAQGNATKVMDLGWHFESGHGSWPTGDGSVFFRHSIDGGRTWQGEVTPPNWKFHLPYKGKPYLRGVSEGSIVRAKNGWLVAALRTDMPPHFFDAPVPNNDNLEGTAISISKDEGKTWSDLDILYDAGRHHAQLMRLPNGDLVCIMIRRVDIKDGKLNSTLRGCDALVSYDNGLTWNLDHPFILDEFEGNTSLTDTFCGHIGNAVLDDGSVLTAFGKYGVVKEPAAVLIKWRPDAKPLQP